MGEDRVANFLLDFKERASERPDIQAVALGGSHARDSATEASDVDLVIIGNNPKADLAETAWIGSFGETRDIQIEDYGKLTSLRVWYESRLEVEYGLTDEGWAHVPLDKGTQGVIAHGMKVLFERDDLLSRLQRSP